MKNPTKRQSQCLKAIFDLLHKNGIYPTIPDVGCMLGLSSTQSVVDLLEPLQINGYLSKEPNRARGIQLTKKGLDYIKNNDWPGHIQSSLFDTSPKAELLSGTLGLYEMQTDSFFINDKMSRRLFDTESASLIADEKVLMPINCKPIDFEITDFATHEYHKKFTETPQNFSEIKT